MPAVSITQLALSGFINTKCTKSIQYSESLSCGPTIIIIIIQHYVQCIEYFQVTIPLTIIIVYRKLELLNLNHLLLTVSNIIKWALCRKDINI